MLVLRITLNQDVDLDLNDYHKCDVDTPNKYNELFCSEDCRYSAYDEWNQCWVFARFTFNGYVNDDSGTTVSESFFPNFCPNCGRILLSDGQTLTIEELLNQGAKKE